MLVVKNGWKIQAKTRDGSSAVVFSIHYAKSKSDEFTEDAVRGALSATADTYADCLTGASGYQYNVKMAVFCNTGTTTAFITVNLYDGANNTPLCQTWALAPNASLFVGDTVSMTDGNGRIITINGQNADTQPVSTVIDYAGTVIPPGWLNCNGAVISRTTYADLFAAIGTTYGTGDGSTTFNLPDCTGRVTAGKEASATRLTAAGGGVTGSTLGSAGGSEFMQSHKHVYLFGATIALQLGSTYTQTGGSNTDTSNTGAGSSQNVQPTIVLYKLIKYANVGVIGSAVIAGVVDGSNAAAGVVGEYQSAEQATATNLLNQTTNYWDAGNLVLTLQPGDWDITANLMLQRNGSSGFTTSGLVITTTGTAAQPADQVYCRNSIYDDPWGTNFTNQILTIPNYRVSISTPTTYRVKVYHASTSGTPQYYGRLSARRMR